jgi:putative transposase
MLPHDFPPHQTVYKYFRKWQRQGMWQAIHDELRGELRQEMGREVNSRIVIADSPSVKTTEKRGRSTVLMAARKLKAVNAIS